MTALDDLIAAVEVGGMTRAQSSTVWKGYEWGFDARVSFVEGAFHGSLDSAKALHDALLPGWEYNVTSAFCLVYPIAAPEDEGIISGYADNPSRAWLLAILRAYRSLQEKPE